jgi:hypothetical protein
MKFSETSFIHSYTNDSIGLCWAPWTGYQPTVRPLAYTTGQQKRTGLYASSGMQTQDSKFRAGEYTSNSCLRMCDHCDRLRMFSFRKLQFYHLSDYQLLKRSAPLRMSRWWHLVFAVQTLITERAKVSHPVAVVEVFCNFLVMVLFDSDNCFKHSSQYLKLSTGIYYFPILEHNHKKKQPACFHEIGLFFLKFRPGSRNIGTKL